MANSSSSSSRHHDAKRSETDSAKQSKVESDQFPPMTAAVVVEHILEVYASSSKHRGTEILECLDFSILTITDLKTHGSLGSGMSMC